MEKSPELSESLENPKGESLTDIFKQHILEIGNEAEKNHSSSFGAEVFGPVTEADKQNAKESAMLMAANEALYKLLGSPQDQNIIDIISAASKNIVSDIYSEEISHLQQGEDALPAGIIQ